MTTKTNLTLAELRALKEEWWGRRPTFGVIANIAMTLGRQQPDGTYDYDDILKNIQIRAKIDTPEQITISIEGEQVYNYQWRLFLPDKAKNLLAELSQAVEIQKKTDEADEHEKERIELIKMLGLEDGS